MAFIGSTIDFGLVDPSQKLSLLKSVMTTVITPSAASPDGILVQCQNFDWNAVHNSMSTGETMTLSTTGSASMLPVGSLICLSDNQFRWANYRVTKNSAADGIEVCLDDKSPGDSLLPTVRIYSTSTTPATQIFTNAVCAGRLDGRTAVFSSYVSTPILQDVQSIEGRAGQVLLTAQDDGSAVVPAPLQCELGVKIKGPLSLSNGTASEFLMADGSVYNHGLRLARTYGPVKSLAQFRASVLYLQGEGCTRTHASNQWIGVQKTKVIQDVCLSQSGLFVLYEDGTAEGPRAASIFPDPIKSIRMSTDGRFLFGDHNLYNTINDTLNAGDVDLASLGRPRYKTNLRENVGADFYANGCFTLQSTIFSTLSASATVTADYLVEIESTSTYRISVLTKNQGGGGSYTVAYKVFTTPWILQPVIAMDSRGGFFLASTSNLVFYQYDLADQTVITSSNVFGNPIGGFFIIDMDFNGTTLVVATNDGALYSCPISKTNYTFGAIVSLPKAARLANTGEKYTVRINSDSSLVALKSTRYIHLYRLKNQNYELYDILRGSWLDIDWSIESNTLLDVVALDGQLYSFRYPDMVVECATIGTNHVTRISNQLCVSNCVRLAHSFFFDATHYVFMDPNTMVPVYSTNGTSKTATVPLHNLSAASLLRCSDRFAVVVTAVNWYIIGLFDDTDTLVFTQAPGCQDALYIDEYRVAAAGAKKVYCYDCRTQDRSEWSLTDDVKQLSVSGDFVVALCAQQIFVLQWQVPGVVWSVSVSVSAQRAFCTADGHVLALQNDDETIQLWRRGSSASSKFDEIPVPEALSLVPFVLQSVGDTVNVAVGGLYREFSYRASTSLRLRSYVVQNTFVSERGETTALPTTALAMACDEDTGVLLALGPAGWATLGHPQRTLSGSTPVQTVAVDAFSDYVALASGRQLFILTLANLESPWGKPAFEAPTTIRAVCIRHSSEFIVSAGLQVYSKSTNNETVASRTMTGSPVVKCALHSGYAALLTESGVASVYRWPDLTTSILELDTRLRDFRFEDSPARFVAVPLTRGLPDVAYDCLDWDQPISTRDMVMDWPVQLAKSWFFYDAFNYVQSDGYTVRYTRADGQTFSCLAGSATVLCCQSRFAIVANSAGWQTLGSITYSNPADNINQAISADGDYVCVSSTTTVFPFRVSGTSLTAVVAAGTIVSATTSRILSVHVNGTATGGYFVAVGGQNQTNLIVYTLSASAMTDQAPSYAFAPVTNTTRDVLKVRVGADGCQLWMLVHMVVAIGTTRNWTPSIQAYKRANTSSRDWECAAQYDNDEFVDFDLVNDRLVYVLNRTGVVVVRSMTEANFPVQTTLRNTNFIQLFGSLGISSTVHTIVREPIVKPLGIRNCREQAATLASASVDVIDTSLSLDGTVLAVLSKTTLAVYEYSDVTARWTERSSCALIGTSASYPPYFVSLSGDGNVVCWNRKSARVTGQADDPNRLYLHSNTRNLSQYRWFNTWANLAGDFGVNRLVLNNDGTKLLNSNPQIRGGNIQQFNLPTWPTPIQLVTDPYYVTWNAINGSLYGGNVLGLGADIGFLGIDMLYHNTHTFAVAYINSAACAWLIRYGSELTNSMRDLIHSNVCMTTTYRDSVMNNNRRCLFGSLNGLHVVMITSANTTDHIGTALLVFGPNETFQQYTLSGGVKCAAVRDDGFWVCAGTYQIYYATSGALAPFREPFMSPIMRMHWADNRRLLVVTEDGLVTALDLLTNWWFGVDRDTRQLTATYWHPTRLTHVAYPVTCFDVHGVDVTTTYKCDECSANGRDTVVALDSTNGQAYVTYPHLQGVDAARLDAVPLPSPCLSFAVHDHTEFLASFRTREATYSLRRDSRELVITRWDL